MRAAIYLRQSLDRTGEGLAVGRQRQACLELCARKGWQPIEYVDNDISASNPRKKRPAYNRMLTDIDDGKIDAVVCWHLDRLHRRPIELENFIEMADRKKLALATVTGDVDLSTDNGRLIARITGAVARGEMERKSARQQAKFRQLADSGKGWGVRAFGYNGDHDKPKLVKKEADILRQAYDEILAGATLHGVAQRLNNAGFATTRGNGWVGSTVRTLLLNPRNAGIRTYKGEPAGPGNWPPIVDHETFNAVTALLKAPSRTPTWVRAGARRGGHKSLLGALMYCGVCHRTMYSSTSGDGYHVYRCKRLDCNGVSKRQEPVDEYITAVVIAKLGTIKWSKPKKRVDEANDLADQAKLLNDRLIELAEALADGDLTRAQVAAATKKINANLAKVEEKIRENAEARVLPSGAEDPVKMWEDMDLDQRRALINRLCRITIMPVAREKRRTSPPEEYIHIDWFPAENR